MSLSPRAISLFFAWVLLVPLLLVSLECFSDAAPGDAALGVVFFAPFAALGALAPLLGATVGHLVGGGEIGATPWKCGLSLTVLALLFGSICPWFFIVFALIPILPVVVLSGVAMTPPELARRMTVTLDYALHRNCR